MKKGVSVIICCYNSAKRLPETIKHLALQKAPSISWEVIIIDNASTDDTASVALKEWNKYGNSTLFKVIREATAGLSYARRRGIEESAFEYLLFCDDDNWLFSNYVETCYKYLSRNGEAGVVGGLGIAKPEIDPPNWFRRYQQWYSTGPQAEKSGRLSHSSAFVYGAGSCYRKSYFLKLDELRFTSLLTDRKKNSLASSGDLELCYAIRLLGGSIYYSDDLKFYHFIPKARISREYFRRLNIGLGQSNVFLLTYLNFIERKLDYGLPVFSILVNNLRRLVIAALRRNSGNSSINYEKYQIWGTLLSIITSYPRLKSAHKSPFFQNIRNRNVH